MSQPAESEYQFQPGDIIMSRPHTEPEHQFRQGDIVRMCVHDKLSPATFKVIEVSEDSLKVYRQPSHFWYWEGAPFWASLEMWQPEQASSHD